MSNNIKKFNKILLVGSGYMAKEYAKVLTALNVDYDVVGKGLVNCEKIEKEFSVKVYSGGIKKFLSNNLLSEYSHIINTVNINFLNETTQSLINHGAEKILLEKPGDLDISGLDNKAASQDFLPANWFDADHLNFYGAKIHTRWFIDQVNFLGLLDH